MIEYLIPNINNCQTITRVLLKQRENLQKNWAHHRPSVEAPSQTMYGTQIPLMVESIAGQHYEIGNDSIVPKKRVYSEFFDMNIKNEKKKLGDDRLGNGYPIRRRRRNTGKKRNRAH